jgi:hypothetical protein
MPRVNSYSVYIAPAPPAGGWTGRVYREIDDHHIGSIERLPLSMVMEAAHALIVADQNAAHREASE